MEDLLHKQSDLYQHHRTIRDKARQALQQHSSIQIHTQSIPATEEQNLQLVQPTATLTEEFHKKYYELFFDHLTNVISSNTITLEIE